MRPGFGGPSLDGAQQANQASLLQLFTFGSGSKPTDLVFSHDVQQFQQHYMAAHKALGEPLNDIVIDEEGAINFDQCGQYKLTQQGE
eukprot:10773078-Lingulodinium_polyedra.AAC.1